MKLQRCANGHFYDGDKYPTCPHCQEAGLPGFKDDETVTQPLNRTPGAVYSVATPAMPAGGYGAGGGETVPVNGFGGGVTMPVGGYGVGGGETVPVNVYEDGATVPVTKPLSGVSADDDEGKTISIYDTINKIFSPQRNALNCSLESARKMCDNTVALNKRMISAIDTPRRSHEQEGSRRDTPQIQA